MLLVNQVSIIIIFFSLLCGAFRGFFRETVSILFWLLNMCFFLIIIIFLHFTHIF
jgi:uncharacterized membrane protein required for colicin V production